MSYPRDIDELSTAELLQELARREDLRQKRRKNDPHHQADTLC